MLNRSLTIQSIACATVNYFLLGIAAGESRPHLLPFARATAGGLDATKRKLLPKQGS